MSQQNQRLKILTAVAIIVLVIGIVAVSAAVLQTMKVKSTGQIKGVGCEIYADEAGTMPVTEINWGILEPGEVKNLTVYIKNVGNVPANLSMHTETWVPSSAESFISFTWDYDNTTLAVDQTLQVVFTLAVDPGITGIYEFSFDIIIIAEG